VHVNYVPWIDEALDLFFIFLFSYIFFLLFRSPAWPPTGGSPVSIFQFIGIENVDDLIEDLDQALK